MKTWNCLSKSGPAAAVMFAGVLVAATGCVEHRVTYVQPVNPVTVQAPEPPPVPATEAPPPQVVELPPPAPPAPVVPMRSAAELDRMLAPIALYPDPLLAQVLPAATLPAQVVLVDRYLREGGDPNWIDAQPWDNSLKGLARYPATIRMLDDNLAWTTALGQAFLNQPADVMNSVQRLRAQAWAIGNLRSTPQQVVVVNDRIIEIVPAAPQVIYVPVYEPEVVYVQRPPAPGLFRVSFGAGLVVGAWLNHDCDWHHHEVIVWHHDHPRPADWWYRPPRERETTVVNNVTVVNNTTVVNQNFTIWHPANRGVAVDRSDGGRSHQDVQPTAPARYDPPKPAHVDAHQAPLIAEAQKPIVQKVPPTAPAREVGPGQPEPQRRPVPTQEKPAHAGPEAVKPAPIVSAHERNAVPTTKQPTPVPSRDPSKPAVVKAPAPETAQPNNGQPIMRTMKPEATPNQPIAAPKDPRPVNTPMARKQPPVPASRSPHTFPPTTSGPVPSATIKAPPSALSGIESAPVTRQPSARGQQSKESMAKPAANSHPAPSPLASPKANSAQTKQPRKNHEQ